MTNLENLSPELPQLIANSITLASGADINEIYRGQNFKTHNSKPGLIWDCIIRNISAQLPNDVLSSIAKCGTWEILLLYCQRSKTLITLMRNTRFNDLKNGSKKDLPHYLKAILSLNRDLDADSDQLSLSLFDAKNYEEDFHHHVLALCSGFEFSVAHEVERHALVVFETDLGILSSLDVYAMTPMMEKAERLDWLNLSKPIIHTAMDAYATDESDAPSLSLKPKAHARTNNHSHISLKEVDSDAGKKAE